MKAFTIRAAMLVAGLALAAGPALAQKAGPGGGGNGGNGGGGANAGGGGATVSGGSVVGSGSGGGATTSSSSGGFSSPSAGGGGGSSQSYGSMRGGAMRTTAPEHRTSFSYSANQHATPAAAPRAASGNRTASNSGGTSAAQPRADASHAVARSGSKQTAANNPAGNREVPSWSRNRGGQPSTGTAIPRSPDNPAPGTAAYYQYYLSRYGYYNPYYYDPSGLYGLYAFGGGYYGFYDPFYSPYGFGGYGLDPGFGYPYYGDPTDPYMYGEGYGSYSSRVYSGQGEGALKLKVKPRNAKVYVDGYFVGVVDQFDGMMQKLTLNGGNHKVEVKADGYETAEFDVLITPGQTLTFSGDLKKLQ